MSIEIVAEGLGFPEGPIAMPDGSVIYVDIVRGHLSRAWKGRSEIIADLEGGPNGAALGPDGAVYVCNNGGIDRSRRCYREDGVARIERVDLSTGRHERLYEPTETSPLRAPNDLVFDAAGNFWFTDTGKSSPTAHEISTLYYASPDGNRIERKYSGGLSYNGVGLSPDETVLYVSDTRSARLWRILLNGPGILKPELSVRGSPEVLVATGSGDVWFDSLAVTAAGTVCIGTIWNGGITAVALDGATRHLSFPDPYVTNIAFGGADMCSAFLTLSTSGRIAMSRWDEPGLKLNFGQY